MNQLEFDELMTPLLNDYPGVYTKNKLELLFLSVKHLHRNEFVTVRDSLLARLRSAPRVLDFQNEIRTLKKKKPEIKRFYTPCQLCNGIGVLIDKENYSAPCRCENGRSRALAILALRQKTGIRYSIGSWEGRI